MNLKKRLKRLQLTRALVKAVKDEVQCRKNHRKYIAELTARRRRLEKELEDL
jgi:hypothetical protein